MEGVRLAGIDEQGLILDNDGRRERLRASDDNDAKTTGIRLLNALDAPSGAFHDRHDAHSTQPVARPGHTPGPAAVHGVASASLQAQTDPAPVYGVSFKDVSVAEFAAGVGDITGTDFVIDPRVRGTLSVESPRPVTAEELYGLFQDTLQNHGYATVRLPDNRVRIVPEQVARTQPLPVGLEDAQATRSPPTSCTPKTSRLRNWPASSSRSSMPTSAP